jgi:hypothetical protein
MILLVVILLLVINPVEFILGVDLTGIDFIIPLILFFRNLKFRFSMSLLIVVILLVCSLFCSYIFSDYRISVFSLIVAIIYYLYPFILYSFSSNDFLSITDIKRTAYLFLLNFIIVRILMFTDVDQKAFPMHDYAFCTALLTFSFLYFYYFENNRTLRVLYLILIFFLLLSILMLKTILALILFLAWDLLRDKGIVHSLLVVSIVILVLYFSPVFSKIDAYYTMYYLNDNAREIPRNLMNLQAISFAWDYFPFGVGPGIFWGFPITLYGSDLYYDLGYHMVQGLNPDKFNEVNYVFDVFWAGILGEGGITSLLFFLIILYFPMKRLEKGSNASSFFKSLFVLLLFQSLVLSILAQPLFLILVVVYPLSFYSWSTRSVIL